MTDWQKHARIDGPVVMVGFGSIGRGALPLILRHLDVDRSRITVIDPDDSRRSLAESQGVRFLKVGLTRDNYRDVLTPLLTEDEGRGFLVNLSVDVGSVDMIALCQSLDVLYIDTVVEPWAGYYADRGLPVAARSNYALREGVLALRRDRPRPTTAISCCGANPGAVSWFVKRALLDLARDLGKDADAPATRAGWAELMQSLGVKGIHIAERDTQRATAPKPRSVFRNTWSVEGFVAEGLQPAELGWGTHERRLPADGRRHDFGCGAAIYLLRPGAGTRVRSWTPTARAQHGFLITHNESISIADYYTLRDGGEVLYRPTCHYAYHPCDDAVLSLHELAGSQWQRQPRSHTLEEHEIVDGCDELGVLLYGHARNAYWFGSHLSIGETRRLAPYQNATGLQVTSAVLAGMVWALENPSSGIVEADELDFARCLDIQRPYLGRLFGEYADWTPLDDRRVLFPESVDESDPWQFSNVLVA
jgi:homospermidine synthase